MTRLMLATLALASTAMAREAPAADASPRSVVVDVLIVRASSLPAELKNGGPTAKVRASLDALKNKSPLAAVTRVSLTSVENQPAMVQVGEQFSVVSGRTARFGGRGSSTSFNQRQVGTLIRVTARIDDHGVVAELQVEQSRIVPARKREEDETAALAPSGSATLTAKNTLHIPAGHTVVMSGMQVRGATGPSHQVVLVSAEPAEPAGGKASRTRPAKTFTVFYLKNAVATDVAKTIAAVLGDVSIQITADARTNALFARGTKTQLSSVQALLKILDQPQAANK